MTGAHLLVGVTLIWVIFCPVAQMFARQWKKQGERRKMLARWRIEHHIAKWDDHEIAGEED